MNEESKLDPIRGYLNKLDLQGPLALARTTGELRTLMQTLVDFSDKLNAPRKVQLLQSETDRLKKEIAGLNEAIEQAEQFDRQHRQLTITRNELQAKFELISDLERQKQSLQDLTTFLADKDPETLLLELRQLQKERQDDIAGFNCWLTEVEIFLDHLDGEFLAETKQLLATVSQKRHNLDDDLENTNASLNHETVYLSKLITKYNQQLGQTSENYRNLAGQLEAIKAKLKEIKDRHSLNMEVYQLHFAANKLIYGELGKQHRLDDHLKDLFAGMETKLRWFDQEIKTLVEKADQLSIV